MPKTDTSDVAKHDHRNEKFIGFGERREFPERPRGSETAGARLTIRPENAPNRTVRILNMMSHDIQNASFVGADPLSDNSDENLTEESNPDSHFGLILNNNLRNAFFSVWSDPKKALLSFAEQATDDQAKMAVETLRNHHGLSGVFGSVAGEGEEEVPPLPDVAPLLWADRPKEPKTNPAKFIVEQYGLWIKAGEFSTVELRRLDLELYTQYAGWISDKRHPEDKIDLPTKSDVVDKKIEKISELLGVLDKRELERQLNSLSGTLRSRRLQI